MLKNVDLPPGHNFKTRGVSFNGAQAARANLNNLNPITVDPRLRAPGMVEGMAEKYRGDLDARAAKLAEVAERQATAIAQALNAVLKFRS